MTRDSGGSIFGHHLYSDIFAHHGPFQHLVAHFYASWISELDFSYIRLFQAILAGVSCATLVFTPALQTKLGGVWAAAVYLLMLAFFWNVAGLNNFLYYTMSGFLLAPLVPQYVVPLVLDKRPSPFWLFISGATSAMACFCAYSNGVALLILILSPLPHLLSQYNHERLLRFIMQLGLGMASAAIVVGIWILRYADLKGYLIYHFYFNERVYKNYIGFTFADFLKNFSLSFAPESIIHSVSLALLACSLYILGLLQKRGRPTTGILLSAFTLLLVCLGVVFMNPRAMSSTGDAGFVTVTSALFALAGACLLERYLIQRLPLGMANTMLLFGAALLLASHAEGYAVSPLGVPERELSNYSGTMKPLPDPIYGFIRSITREDGDLLALNYDSTIYLKTARLPASGSLFSLPWQAEYNGHPKGGYKNDICADIKTHRPAVIWFFNWRVWDKYSLDDYEPCILQLLTEGYTPLKFDSPWHVRNDLYRDAVSELPSNANTSFDLGPAAPKVLSLSLRLTRFAPIRIVMSPTHLERNAALRRIGILFGTYGGQTTGAAELRLQGPGGAEDSLRIFLPDLGDNKYHFFEVDPKFYTTGEIRTVTGEGISAWESHLDNSASYTCLIYEYTNNTRRYTPACPIM